MRLVLATAEYEVDGSSLQGHPLLLTSEMELLKAPNDYLYILRSHRGYAETTVTTYAWALYDFFSWVEAQGRNWTRPVNPRDRLATPLLAEYRNWQKKLLSKVGRPSLATIRQYLTVCNGFYAWAAEEGLISAKSPKVRVSPSGKPDSTSSSSSEEPRPKDFAKNRRFLPKCLSVNQIQTICSSITNSRDRLMVMLALSAGLRRSEVVTFPAHLVPDHVPATGAAERIPVEIVPCTDGPADEPVMRIKGNVPRRIYLHPRVMEALSLYRNFGEAVEAAHRYEDTYGAKSPRLFLSEAGRPLSISHLNRVCSKVTREVGFDVWPHLFRHTFSTHELHMESQRRSPTEALIWLRDRLGHALLATTQQYTSLQAELSPDEANGYQSFLSHLT